MLKTSKEEKKKKSASKEEKKKSAEKKSAEEKKKSAEEKKKKSAEEKKKSAEEKKKKSAVSTVFENKDLKRLIFTYSKQTCRDLTKNYYGCTPDFAYQNRKTGRWQFCRKECLNHIDEWITPLLEVAPTKVTIADRYNNNEKFTLDLQYTKLTLWKRGDPWNTVTVLWTKDNWEGERNAYVPKYYVDAGRKIREWLLSFDGYTVELHIELPVPSFYRSDQYKIVDFPGNSVWNRFKPHIIAAYSLRMDFRL